ncbi:MAG: hypothetical protein O9284_15320 [Steroidobacteraceae bacterium]|jgi:hypothetical protein|nr:hypothetical protein [Steroidobacteraceae bacterium]
MNASLDAMHDIASEPLARLIARDRALRTLGHDDPPFAATLARLRRWQGARLAATYADLAAQPRYAPAIAFFLEELYGDVDVSPRDHDLERAHRALEKALPDAAIEALRRAIALEVLTQELDAEVARRLPQARAITGRDYAESYRAAGSREFREQQIDWIVGLGDAIETLVRTPGLGLLVKLARRPAHAAGFGALHEFLERGYRAFHQMHGAGEFLGIVRTREWALLERLYAGEPDPFAGLPLNGTAAGGVP